MALLYLAGGVATFVVNYGSTHNSYTFKLRDMSIDGGQPEEIDITTSADIVAKSHESTATQDRISLEVLWEDGTSTGTGPAVINPSYEDMRAAMHDGTNDKDFAATLTLKLWDGSELETIYNGISAKLIDVQARAPRNEAATLSLTFLSERAS
tara:strand:+ start:2882 stop:3340 length:459 start_codon:yes stop_codon:yes gene_type:complete